MLIGCALFDILSLAFSNRVHNSIWCPNSLFFFVNLGTICSESAKQAHFRFSWWFVVSLRHQWTYWRWWSFGICKLWCQFSITYRCKKVNCPYKFTNALLCARPLCCTVLKIFFPFWFTISIWILQISDFEWKLHLIFTCNAILDWMDNHEPPDATSDGSISILCGKISLPTPLWDSCSWET